jgi:TonB family protein
MKLASFFVISVAFHAAIFTLSFSFLESGGERVIPVVLLISGDGSGQGTVGDGKKAEGQRDSGNSIRKKRLALTARSADKKGSLSQSRNKNRIVDQSAEDVTSDDPRVFGLKESIESVGLIPVGVSTTETRGGGNPTIIALGGLAEGIGAGREASGEGGPGNSAGAGANGGASTPGLLFSQASYAHNPKPKYPERARREGWEGTVLLRVLVDEEGKSKSIEIDRSSGFETLDYTAVETVKRWRFFPARRGGGRVESWVKIPIVFRLADLKD